jgi:hypothetical protein
MSKALLKYYEAFIDEPNNCCNLIKLALAECYQWIIQSFGDSKSFTCSYAYTTR